MFNLKIWRFVDLEMGFLNVTMDQCNNVTI